MSLDKETTERMIKDEETAAEMIGETYISKCRIALRFIQALAIGGVSSAAAYGISHAANKKDGVPEYSACLVGGISFLLSLGICWYTKGVRHPKNLGFFSPEDYTSTSSCDLPQEFVVSDDEDTKDRKYDQRSQQNDKR